jgi:YegS/Rv2252/BmrU family lipid kinase
MKTKQELQKIISEEKSAVLVVNTHSRNGEQLFFRAMDELAEKGINITASYPVRHPDRLSEIIKEAIGRQGSLVIVGGGDGTISSIVDYFAYQDVVLGILPLGTGNSFARTLGISLTLEGAVDVIAQGKVADIDLGKINDDYFANMAAIGFSADVAHSSPHLLKRFLGPLSYLLVAVGQFFRHRSFSCTFRTAHDEQKIKTHQVLIANGSFMGETLFTPAVSPDDRSLIVFTMDMLNRWQTLKLWIAFTLGKYTAFSEAKYFRTREIRIETDPPQYIDVDGEKTTQTPVTVSLAPEALKVLVPSSFQDTDE